MATQYPILYSFRRCPYAMRARIALLASGITVELREVVLRDKPVEMLAVSPKGTVPVLLLPDGRVLDESLDIMEYALTRADPFEWVSPEVGSEDEMRALITVFDTSFKHHLDRYKYAARYEGAEAWEHRLEASQHVAALETRLEQVGAYLFGDAPKLADYAIMPFVRQFAGVDRAWFEDQPWPSVQKWLRVLIDSSEFTNVMKKYTQWQVGDEPLFFGSD